MFIASFSGRGIVLAAGGPKYFGCAYITIRIIREVVTNSALWYDAAVTIVLIIIPT
jgi:hypothetical protein